MDDIDAVTRAYEWCWQRSKGWYNAWIDGRLHPLARRFYIVVNATEVCLMSGVPSLLEETRFSLAETAEAFASFGFDQHAAAIRALAALVDDHRLSRDRRERGLQLSRLVLLHADVDRLNRMFPCSQSDEDKVWHELAEHVRQHPEAFSSQSDGT